MACGREDSWWEPQHARGAASTGDGAFGTLSLGAEQAGAVDSHCHCPAPGQPLSVTELTPCIPCSFGAATAGSGLHWARPRHS